MEFSNICSNWVDQWGPDVESLYNAWILCYMIPQEPLYTLDDCWMMYMIVRLRKIQNCSQSRPSFLQLTKLKFQVGYWNCQSFPVLNIGSPPLPQVCDAFIHLGYLLTQGVELVLWGHDSTCFPGGGQMVNMPEYLPAEKVGLPPLLYVSFLTYIGSLAESGSPLLDFILNTHPSGLSIPVDWSQISLSLTTAHALWLSWVSSSAMGEGVGHRLNIIYITCFWVPVSSLSNGEGPLGSSPCF